MIMTGIRSIFEFQNGSWAYNNFEWFEKVFTDIDFYNAILNTFLIFVIYTLIKIPLVILTALLLSTMGKGQKIYLKFMYLPMLVGMFAYGIIFRYMFTYDGIINSVLYSVLKIKIDWLGNSLAAQNVLVFAMLWGSFGISVLMVTNVINRIPRNILDYARIEGSSWFRTLWKIILPAIKPIVFTIMMLSLIETIGLIDVPMNLTQGGPEMSTVTLGYYIYKQALDYSNFSYASTISIVLFAITLLPFVFYSIFNFRKEKNV